MINRITPASFVQSFWGQTKAVGEAAKVKRNGNTNSLERTPYGDTFTSSKSKSKKQPKSDSDKVNSQPEVADNSEVQREESKTETSDNQ